MYEENQDFENVHVSDFLMINFVPPYLQKQSMFKKHQCINIVTQFSIHLPAASRAHFSYGTLELFTWLPSQLVSDIPKSLNLVSPWCFCSPVNTTYPPVLFSLGFKTVLPFLCALFHFFCASKHTYDVFVLGCTGLSPGPSTVESTRWATHPSHSPASNPLLGSTSPDPSLWESVKYLGLGSCHILIWSFSSPKIVNVIRVQGKTSYFLMSHPTHIQLSVQQLLSS